MRFIMIFSKGLEMKFLNKDVIIKGGWMGGFAVLYFLLIRPLRALYSKNVVYEILLSSQFSIGNIESAFHSSRRVLITYLNDGSEMVLSHIPQFGFFFLCGMLGLIFFNASRRSTIGLVLFQLVVELLVFFLFWVGIHYSIAGFIISDFLITYLSPLGCLGFVVFASLSRE